MPIHPPSRRRERILGYGGTGSGKTSMWVNVAKWLEKTNAAGNVYVLDTDRTTEASVPLALIESGRVVVEEAWDWAEYKPALNRLTAKRTPDDWLVVDMADKLWTKAQQGFFEYLTDGAFDEFIAESVKNNINIGGEWGTNWGAINKMYAGLIDFFMRWKGHALWVTPETDVRTPDRSGKGGDSEEIRGMFGRLGVRPQGQKDLPHLFHTVLLMQNGPKGYVMTSAKDRERELMKGVKVEEFVVSYLFGRAGWRP